MNHLTHIILPNALLFQGVWWACMLSWPLISMVLLMLMAVHFVMTGSYSHSSDNGAPQDWLILPISVVGMMSDWLMYQMGFYTFADGGFPIWLILLWLAFPMTLTRSLRSVVGKSKIWIPLCVVFGPLAYLGGEHFGQIELMPFSLVAMMLQWGLLGVLCVFVLSEDDEIEQPIGRTLTTADDLNKVSP